MNEKYVQELKNDIKKRNKETMKLQQKLWELEDREYNKKIKKNIGKIYLKTFGRGKNKEYSFFKLMGCKRRALQVIEIYLCRREKYNLSEVTSGRKVKKQELIKHIREMLEDGS